MRNHERIQRAFEPLRPSRDIDREVLAMAAKKRTRGKALVGVCAAVVLAAAGGLWLLNRAGVPPFAVWNGGTPLSPADAGGGLLDGDPAGYVQSPSQGEGVSAAPEETEVPTQEGVYVEAIQPAFGQEGAASMMGMVVYRGGVYTAAGEISGAGWELLGEDLGPTQNLIDCFTGQEHPEYFQLELASTYDGEVYTVAGYDSDFRLAVLTQWREDGRERVAARLMERLSGIRLTTGRDLFGPDRLNLVGRVLSMDYQTHEDWDMGRENLLPLALDPEGEAFRAFLKYLETGLFEDRAETDPDIYNDPDREQLHLYLRMEDGTTVELRLWEDGTVAYQPLPWVVVSAGPEAAEAVFQAAGLG